MKKAPAECSRKELRPVTGKNYVGNNSTNSSKTYISTRGSSVSLLCGFNPAGPLGSSRRGFRSLRQSRQTTGTPYNPEETTLEAL